MTQLNGNMSVWRLTLPGGKVHEYIGRNAVAAALLCHPTAVTHGKLVDGICIERMAKYKPTSKVCTGCGKLLPLDAYSQRGRDCAVKAAQCKTCKAKRMRQHYQTTKKKKQDFRCRRVDLVRDGRASRYCSITDAAAAIGASAAAVSAAMRRRGMCNGWEVLPCAN
jgi:hypothetical protein